MEPCFKYSILTKEKILLTHPHMVKSEKIGFNLEFTLSDVFLRKFERLRPPSCYPFALLLLGGFRSFQSQFLRDFDPLTSILK